MAAIAGSTFTAPSKAEQPLNPFVAIDPAANEKSHLRYSYLWKTAAIISAIAFIALAVGSMIFATLYAESYLPVVSLLTVYPGMPLSLVPFNACWIKGMEHALASKQEGEIKNLLSTLSDSEYPKPQLKPLCARYKWTVAQVEAKKELAKQLLDLSQTHQVGSVNLSKDRAEFNLLTQKRIRHIEIYEEAAFFQINAAFYLKLMNNPCETRQVTDFLTPVQINPAARLLASAHRDQTAHTLIKTPSGKCFTADDILSQTPQDLLQKIFNA